MKKRGQVTIFVIIAIVIVASLIILLTFKSDFFKNLFQTEKERFLSQQSASVRNFVESCIKETTLDGAYFIGRRGGYLIAPEDSTEFDIPYYFIENRSYIPTKERIEEELAAYVDQELFFCTENFVDFPEVQIEPRESKTTVAILDDFIVLNVNYPIRISKGNSSALVRDFEEIGVPLRLGTIYDVAYLLTQKQVEEPDSICLSCIIELTTENDLLIDMYDYDENTVIFTIEDEIEDKPRGTYGFKFANKYRSIT